MMRTGMRGRAVTARIATTVLALALLAIAGASSAQSVHTRLAGEEAKRFNSISDQLVCQCGCQMVLRVCNHQNCPSAIPLRQSIENQIEQGRSDDEIVQGFVDEHGVKILSSPPVEGFNLAAYVMPGFALLVGILLIAHFAGHWAARRRIESPELADGNPVDPQMRDRIEREIEARNS